MYRYMTAAPLTPRCQAAGFRRACHFRRKAPSCCAALVPVPTRSSTPLPAPLLTDIYEILPSNYTAFGAFVKGHRERFDNNIFAPRKNISAPFSVFSCCEKSVRTLDHFQNFRFQREHSADVQGIARAVGPALYTVQAVVHVAGDDGHAVLVGDGQLAAICSVSTSRSPMIW